MTSQAVSIDSVVGRLHGTRNDPTDTPRGLALHVHGTWGNFEGNAFIPATGDVYKRNGYTFGAVNFSGHDELAAHEHLEQFEQTLQAWLDYFKPVGEIVLQGHSLGALKILHLFACESALAPRITKVVLLSPFDVVGFYAREASVANARQIVKDLSGETGTNTLIPAEVFRDWQLSTGTYLELTEPNGVWDLFPTRHPFAIDLLDLPIPTFAALGSEDFASIPDAPIVFDMLDPTETLSGTFIAGATHNFEGHEEILCEHLDAWLQRTA